MISQAHAVDFTLAQYGLARPIEAWWAVVVYLVVYSPKFGEKPLGRSFTAAFLTRPFYRAVFFAAAGFDSSPFALIAAQRRRWAGFMRRLVAASAVAVSFTRPPSSVCRSSAIWLSMRCF
ncbi:MAG: hypothetical protein DMG58_14400 [Acidobacteria bacterium]|nr:MAG: hypothetical protein DMG58_14400 [Acidobacteriota bacterium]